MDKAIWIMAGAAAALIAVAPASSQRGRAGPPTFGSGRHHATPGPTTFRSPRHGFGRHSRCGTNNGACYDGPFLDLWGYGGLIEDPDYEARDQGFFSGPAEVLAGNGGAYYDYDRAYPYDWYHEPGAAARGAPVMASASPAMRCEMSWVAGSGGARSPVRVCRGRR